jgi:hypothetical protein
MMMRESINQYACLWGRVSTRRFGLGLWPAPPLSRRSEFARQTHPQTPGRQAPTSAQTVDRPRASPTASHWVASGHLLCRGTKLMGAVRWLGAGKGERRIYAACSHVVSNGWSTRSRRGCRPFLSTQGGTNQMYAPRAWRSAVPQTGVLCNQPMESRGTAGPATRVAPEGCPATREVASGRPMASGTAVDKGRYAGASAGFSPTPLKNV